MGLGVGWALIIHGAQTLNEGDQENRQEIFEDVWDLEVEGIRDPLEGIVQVEESSWETLPKNVFEKIESYLTPVEIVRLRTCNRQVMGNWWIWPRDRFAYYRWMIVMARHNLEYHGEIRDEILERDRRYREEKERKREEEEDAQEARIPAALEEYLRDHGKIPGVGYRSIARKYKIDQQQLRDAVTQHDEEMLEESDDDDPYP